MKRLVDSRLEEYEARLRAARAYWLPHNASWMVEDVQEPVLLWGCGRDRQQALAGLALVLRPVIFQREAA